MESIETLLEATLNNAAKNTILSSQHTATPCIFTAHLGSINFTPKLPDAIYSNLQPSTQFILDGYTLESVQLNGNTLSFEAGFGEENFASVVSLDLSAIYQIALLRGENVYVVFSRIEALQFANALNELDSKNAKSNQSDSDGAKKKKLRKEKN